MTCSLRILLKDQLSESLEIIAKSNKKTDIFLIFEVIEEATYVKYHKQKLVFTFSAMRHFAEQLKSSGYRVEYVKIDDPQNSQTIENEIDTHIKKFQPKTLIVTEPSEWWVLQKFKALEKKLDIPIEILPDTRFLCDHVTFDLWAKGKKQLRMEFFYREMRKTYHFLINEDGTPVGGAWNFDKENREPPSKEATYPQRFERSCDTITSDVIRLIELKFSDHFGELKHFNYAVTREDAIKELDTFISLYLPNFGTYQDAMVKNEPYLYHSRISAYINAGLILPLEACEKAELAYKNKKAPLNCVEGFIRQIIGWREFIRGIYWHFMPNYGRLNYLNAKTPLPEFYWSGKTKMACLSEAISHTRDYAYSHHIQRLMITGNFALLAGLDVKQVQEWYLAVYADAYEWVEMPNTLGMALYGDGGIVASKPYAASGKYIQKMSNFCKSCPYNPNESIGPKACPFNSLYWDFLTRHEDKLRSNPRMTYMFNTWDKFDETKQEAIKSQAAEVLLKIQAGNI